MEKWSPQTTETEKFRTDIAETIVDGKHGKPATELPERGHVIIPGNSTRRASSLTPFGVVAIGTKTDGAAYEPLITFGAKEDAIETTSNTKGTTVKSYVDVAKKAHTEVEGFRAAIVDLTKVDLEAETPNFDTHTVISDEGVKSNTESIS